LPEETCLINGLESLVNSHGQTAVSLFAADIVVKHPCIFHNINTFLIFIWNWLCQMMLINPILKRWRKSSKRLIGRMNKSGHIHTLLEPGKFCEGLNLNKTHCFIFKDSLYHENRP
jgi:hypothetical protein